MSLFKNAPSYALSAVMLTAATGAQADTVIFSLRTSEGPTISNIEVDDFNDCQMKAIIAANLPFAMLSAECPKDDGGTVNLLCQREKPQDPTSVKCLNLTPKQGI